MNQLMRGEPMRVFGDGGQTRAFSYVADVAPLIARAIHVPAAFNDVFNVSADAPTTVNDLAVLVARAMGGTPNITHLDARHEVVHAVADHSKVERVFGYKAEWSLADGLTRMAGWAKQSGPIEPGKRFDVELARNLPASWAG